jgi:hypothetical protein
MSNDKLFETQRLAAKAAALWLATIGSPVAPEYDRVQVNVTVNGGVAAIFYRGEVAVGRVYGIVQPDGSLAEG